MTDEKELFWKVAAELFTAERHFNTMQNHCRTLASTWLLATFAAIGFVYTQEKLVVDRDPAAALVAFAGASGIFLVWIIDVRIWHRLLLANSLAGHRIEIDNPWLPRIREYVTGSRGWFPVRVHLSLFYGLGAAMLVVIGSVCLARSMSGPAGWVIVAGSVAGIGIVAVMILTAYASHRRDDKLLKAMRNAAAASKPSQ